MNFKEIIPRECVIVNPDRPSAQTGVRSPVEQWGLVWGAVSLSETLFKIKTFQSPDR